MITWTVYGLPAPQGSAKGFLHHATGRVVITHANRRTVGWRQEVAAALVQALPGGLDGALFPRPAAVRVAATFFLPRPKSLPKRIVTPASRPDLDKLLRAALDAMTGLAFDDDAQVAVALAEKAYGTPPRAEFAVVSLAELAAWPPPAPAGSPWDRPMPHGSPLAPPAT